MAYVDLGELNYVTLSPGWVCTAWNTAGNDFRAGQWYRAAPWLDSDNSPGTTIVIGDSGTAFGRSGESVSIDDNGNVIVLLTTKNVGKGTAAIGMQWLSAPEIGE